MHLRFRWPHIAGTFLPVRFLKPGLKYLPNSKQNLSLRTKFNVSATVQNAKTAVVEKRDFEEHAAMSVLEVWRQNPWLMQGWEASHSFPRKLRS